MWSCSDEEEPPSLPLGGERGCRNNYFESVHLSCGFRGVWTAHWRDGVLSATENNIAGLCTEVTAARILSSLSSLQEKLAQALYKDAAGRAKAGQPSYLCGVFIQKHRNGENDTRRIADQCHPGGNRDCRRHNVTWIWGFSPRGV